MEIDIPEVKAEVEEAFAAYERALVGNDVAALDDCFLDRRTTIRYGSPRICTAIRRSRPSAPGAPQPVWPARSKGR